MPHGHHRRCLGMTINETGRAGRGDRQIRTLPMTSAGATGVLNIPMPAGEAALVAMAIPMATTETTDSMHVVQVAIQVSNGPFGLVRFIRKERIPPYLRILSYQNFEVQVCCGEVTKKVPFCGAYFGRISMMLLLNSDHPKMQRIA